MPTTLVYVNNNGANQPVYTRSVINAFLFAYVQVWSWHISTFKLATYAAQAVSLFSSLQKLIIIFFWGGGVYILMSTYL